MLAFAAGLVSATGFAPLGYWPLTLAACALLFHLVRSAKSWRAALGRSYSFGLGHFILGLNWIAGAFHYQNAMPPWLGWVAVIGLSLYLALFAMAAFGLAWRIAKKWRDIEFVFLVAGLWVVAELARASLFTGFAWNPLSAAFVSAADATRLVGTYGVSGLALLVAASVWMAARRQWRAALWTLAAPLGLSVAGGLGPALTPPPALRNAPQLRIVQPNIGQQDKHDAHFDAINFQKLAAHTGASGAEPRLVFWPEAAVPDYLEEDASARLRLARLLGPQDLLLTGGVALEYDRSGKLVGARNSVFLIDPQARLLGRYDKAHLVPYGEYLPMRPMLSAIGLSRLVPGDIDFWPGAGPASLALPGGGHVGLQICYEMIFSGQVVDERHRPDFLFNPSNDAWFGSWGPPQHLAQARLRALEEGLPVIRSTPTGISALIDADGTVVKALPYQQAGAITASLPPARTPTLFARFGLAATWALALALCALGIALRRALR